MQSINKAICLFRVLNVQNQPGVLTQSIRSYYKKEWTYDERYTGKFDYHDQHKYPRRMNPYKEEEVLDEVWKLREKQVDNPSPFHVVTRVRGYPGRIAWTQHVTLRRLNLHSTQNGDVALVPNTPQFNELINKVKHLLILKPAVFPDGRFPTEEDIGALKICPMTGVVRIDEKVRLRAKRLNLKNPEMFQGNFLRYKLAAQDGHRKPTYLGGWQVGPC